MLGLRRFPKEQLLCVYVHVVEMDKAEAMGMSADSVADRVVESVCAGDSEVLIGPLLYRVAVYLRNFLPNAFFHVMARRARRQHSKTS